MHPDRSSQTFGDQFISEFGHRDLTVFGFVVKGADVETGEGGGVRLFGHRHLLVELKVLQDIIPPIWVDLGEG